MVPQWNHPLFYFWGEFSFKVIAFITDYQAVDRIIEHLKLMFVAEKPLPGIFEQVVLTRPPREGLRNAALMAAEESGAYFMD